MNLFTKKIVPFALGVAIMGTAGIPVSALTNSTTLQVNNRPKFFEKIKTGDKNWNFNNMTEEEKTERINNFKSKLEEKLASGEITQERYDEVVEKIESGTFKVNKKTDESTRTKIPKLVIRGIKKVFSSKTN